jgi:hypothetical protein
MTKDEELAMDLALEALEAHADIGIKQARSAPVQSLPFGVGGGLVAIKTLLSRDPCVHANTAIEMIDAILKEHPAAQPAPVQEPVAWDGYNLEDMCEAFDRVIEEHHQRKNPFHDPVNKDAMIALRVLRGFVPYMKLYTTPPKQPVPVQEPEYWNVLDPTGNVVASETDAIRGWARIAGSYKPTVEGLLGFHDQGWRVLPKVTPFAQPAPVQEPDHPFCDCGQKPHEMHLGWCAHAKSKVEWAGVAQKARYRAYIEAEWLKLNPPAAQPAPVQEPVGYEYHEYRPYGAPGEIRINAILKSRYAMPDGSTAGDYQWLIDQYRANINTIKLIPLYTTAAQPAVPDAIHHTDLSESLEYIQGWNDCRQAMLEMMK